MAKWLLLGLTLVVLAGLTAAFYEWMVRRHRAVPLLVFSALDYDAPLPPNAWADEDAKRLEKAWSRTSWFGVQDAAIQVSREPTAGWGSGDEFLGEVAKVLQKAKPGGPDKNVILLYVSAHGLLDDQEDPVLLLGRFAARADMAPPIGTLPPRVRVADLLERLDRSRPPESKVVLFLDAGRMASNWQLGVLQNSFAEKLPQVVDDAKVSSLILINSAATGQIGWCLPSQGCSAFGRFVCDGLEGHADENPQDGRVTFHELREYLRGEIGDCVRDECAAVQEPQFLGPEADFGLAYADSALEGPPARVRDVVPASLRQELDRLWQIHERLAPWESPAGSLRRSDWLGFEAFQQGLVRLEELCQAGRYYAADAEALQLKLAGLAQYLQRQADQPSDPTAPSLPLALRLSPDQRKTLRDRIRDHWLGVKEAQPLQELNDLTPDEVASAVWERLLDDGDEWRVELIDRALKLVQNRIAVAENTSDSSKAGVRERGELVEMRTLRQLRSDGYLADSVRTQPQVLKETLQTRRAAEEAASAASEILALDAIRLLADLGDGHRRHAEDCLFVGRAEDADRLCDEAKRRYEQARETEADLSTVLTTRDRIWLEVPCLVQWAAGLHVQAGNPNDNKQSIESSLRLLEAAATLDRKLYERISQWRDAPREQPDAAADEVHRQIGSELLLEANRLTGQLDELHRILDEEVRNATEKSEGIPSLVRIRNLLRTPLVSGRTRRRLSESCAGVYLAGSTADAAFWRDHPDTPHPASLLVERNTGPRNDSPTAIRGHLQQLAAKLTASEGAAGAAEPHDAWLSRSRNARDATAAVSLLVLAGSADRPEELLNNPLGQLETYYQAELWLWQAQRLLEDFYGDDGATRGDPPYFARMAEACLAKAVERYAELPGIEAANKLRQDRIVAAQIWESGSWLGLASDKVPLAMRPTGQGQVQQTLRPELPEDLPGGLAALFLEDPDRQRTPFEARESAAAATELAKVWEYPLNAADSTAPSRELPLAWPVVAPDALPDRSLWALGVFYRGHRAERRFVVERHREGQVVRVSRPARADDSVVHVIWKPAPGTVAFCLDCSRSMDNASRMQNALKILSSTLGELELHPTFSVSLWLFGHRRYFEGAVPPFALTWNEHWESETGESNNPAITFENDVQLVWRRNADWMVERVPSLLNVSGTPSWNNWLDEKVILPYGYTPLHLAMDRAIREHLGKTNNAGARRLIVLSDGMHKVGKPADEGKAYVFTPPWKYDAAKDRTEQQVADTLVQENRDTRQPVEILLVADLDVKGELNELRGVISRALADGQVAGGCSLYETKFEDLEAVLVKLRYSLGLYQPALRREQPPRETLPGFALNRDFKFAPNERGRYTVDLHFGDNAPLATARLAVEGGEALRLEVKHSQDGATRLEHLPYLRGGVSDDPRSSATVPTKTSSPLDDDFNPPRFRVSAHAPQPLLDGSGWRFPISIRNIEETRFSPRPISVWVEVTPSLVQDGSVQAVGRPFVWYDLAWEANEPVPVLALEATPWPSAANAADVRLWFKLDDSEFDEQPLEKIRSDSEDDYTWQLDEQGVKFAVIYNGFQAGNRRGCEVVVLEQQLAVGSGPPDRSAPATRVRVELSEPAVEVERQFYPELGRVRHRFRYLDVDETAVGAYRLRISSVEALRKNAAEFRIPQPLSVAR